MLSAQFGARAAFAGACADQIALEVGQAANHGNNKPPRASGCIRPRFGKAEKLSARVDDLFDDGEKLEHGSGQTVDARHHHLIAGSEGFQESAEFLAVNLRAGNLLAIDA